MDTANNGLKTLDEVILRNGDTPMVCLGLRQSFYTLGAETLETRISIGKCIEYYLDLFGEHITQQQMGFRSKRKTKKIGIEAFIRKNHKENAMFHASYTGKDYDILDWYNLVTFADGAYDYGEGVIKPDKAFLTFTIPLSELVGRQRGFFQQMMKDILSILNQPCYAHGGFSTIFPVEWLNANELTYPLLRRFPGLDEQENSSSHFAGEDLEHGIKGIQFLTYINSNHIKTLGGLDKIKYDAGKGFLFDEIQNGVLIQAGATPQLGDVNTGHFPAYYYKLGKVLAPIRIDSPDRFYFVKPNPGVWQERERIEKTSKPFREIGEGKNG